MRRIAARAVDEQNGPFVHSALINVGTRKGVKQGFAVMTSDGFYGHVVRAGDASARVLLANDLSSRIAVKSARSESRAIMVGANAARPELRYVAEQADWQQADLVVTSGDDGVLPAGLPIGTVSLKKEGVLEVELFSMRNPVDWIFVTEFIPVLPPPETLTQDEIYGEDTP